MNAPASFPRERPTPLPVYKSSPRVVTPACNEDEDVAQPVLFTVRKKKVDNAKKFYGSIIVTTCIVKLTLFTVTIFYRNFGLATEKNPP